MSYVASHWDVRKPAVRSKKGLVAAKYWEASQAGAEILRNGGNAVDAAIATALAIGCVEPWMSGIGGGGYMMVYEAATRRTYAIDFHMVAPRKLDPKRYPLAGGEAAAQSIFVWPRVEDDRNLRGYEAIAVPGAIDGFRVALERFGSKPWAELVAPAIALADEGVAADWHTTLQIAYGMANGLTTDPVSAAIYCPNGAPLTSVFPHKPARKPIPKLADTLRRLAEAGPRDFYDGQLARSIVADLQAGGCAITEEDMAAYQAEIKDPLTTVYRGAEVHVPPGLCGGPTFSRALRNLSDTLKPGSAPDAASYAAWAAALKESYEFRLTNLGHDGDPSLLTSTTHFSVADAAGNMVSLTNTLLEPFGSRVTLPDTGIIMNNGIMWFDPRPGAANSMAPGVKPLSNMCPVAVTRDGGGWFAIGASGGRRIVPCVLELSSLMIDFGMTLEEAFHAPRVDVSGGNTALVDRRLGEDVLAAVQGVMTAELTEQTVLPNVFAVPQGVMRDGDENVGCAHVWTPTAAVVTA